MRLGLDQVLTVVLVGLFLAVIGWLAQNRKEDTPMVVWTADASNTR